MSTLAETTLILKRLSSAYGQPVDVERARAYHQVLGHYPRMVLADAATIALTRGSQFLPKPIELLDIIQRQALTVRWVGADRYDERAFWLAYAKGYVTSDEFNQADIETIFSGMEGRVPYKEPTGKIYGKITLERARELYRENKNQSIKQGA